VGARLDSIRAAVEKAKVIAEEFHTATASFYVDGNTTPVLICTGRYKKPKPSSFDAGNQTEWSTKRLSVLKVPLEFPAPYTGFVITKGLIVQISTPDGDPTINKINFTVQSALTSQFAAEREVTLATEIRETQRIT
jgi:hypothetical protein